jgi:hypothetical protein
MARLVLVFLAMLILPAAAALDAPLLSREEIDAKIAALAPTKDEDKFLTVRWRTSLMEARAEAQLQGKPIFMWIMNGNPLGCT